MPNPSISQNPTTLNTSGNARANAPLGTYRSFASLNHAKISWIIKKYRLQSTAQALLSNQIVAKCLRTRQSGTTNVQIFYDKAKERAHYRGLIRCTSVWHCPICASAITEVRKQEFTKATSHPDYYWVMLTYTLHHAKGDLLRDIKQIINGAYREYHAGIGYQGMKRRYNIVGSVKAFECTHGINSWHPHIHEAVCMTEAPDIEALETGAKRRWLRILEKHGGEGSWERALVVKSGDRYMSEYIAKWGRNPRNESWGLEDEITKQPVKSGRIGGYTPFELLAVAAGLKSNTYSLISASALFTEYAMTMKGKHQLEWSRGLKDRFGIGEVSNEEIIEQENDDMWLLASLAPDDWGRVLRYKQRAQLIALAHEGNAPTLYKFLNALKARQRSEQK